ncbi:MAG: hypothetical protein ABWJ99_00625 [Caldimicrobium sp.]
MKEKKEREEKEEEKPFCEKYKEYVSIKEGCKHPKEYCQFRKQCLLYFKSKFKDF